MSPRKNYDKEIEERLQKYLEQYEIETPNDIASLRAMCALEIGLEKQQKALLNIDPTKFPKKIKDLQSSIRDSTNSYTELQRELKIDRRKRQEEESDVDPRKYIEKLQDYAYKFLDSRLKKITCPKCGQVLGKYFIYVDGEGERPVQVSRSKGVETVPINDNFQELPFTLRIGCWKCYDLHKRDKKHPKTVVEISNENIVITEGM